jgi:3-deoxy-D-manno-octulosonic-acid transferase
MSPCVYRWATWLLQGPLLLKLLWRSRKEPAYRHRLGERFGWYTPTLKAKAAEALASPVVCIWVHAVSLGETHASLPLLEGLRQRYPGCRFVLTHGTATGREAGQKLLQPDDIQVWLPWDTTPAVSRFLNTFRPDLGLLMETEVWPTLVAQCKRQAIPLVLVNARMNEKSLQRTLRYGGAVMANAYQDLQLVIPQTSIDAARLTQLGGRVTKASGNIKFDQLPDPALQQKGLAWRTASSKPVVVFASSREGEELLFLQAIKEAARPDVQWLLVPRHPQRFDEVAALVAQAKLSVSRRSGWPAAAYAPLPEANVWLGDSLGEMPAYYSLASCALMGGTFLPYGGQNLIEACQYGCPVILGPSTFNFHEAANQAIASQAATQVDSMAAGVAAALSLLAMKATLADRQADARAFAALHSGATHRTLQALTGILSR